MKRCFVAALVFISVIAAFLYLQYGRDVKVETSIQSCSSDFYEQRVTVIANKIFILDEEKFAKKLVERCRVNTFHEVLFSYDIAGYPNKIYISVYLNEWSWKLGKNHFTVLYETDARNNHTYNVKDDSKVFKIDAAAK